MAKKKYAHLPAAVRAQAEASDLALEQLEAQRQADLAAHTAQPAADPQLEPAPAPDPAIDPAIPAPPGGDPDYRALYEELRQQHSTLTGKYNSEVPKLHERLRELESHLVRVTSELALTRAAPVAPAAPAPPEPKPWTDEQERVLGVDALELMWSIAKKEAKKEAGQVAGAVVENVERRMDRITEADFWREFQKLVPNYQQINADPLFQSFVAEIDRASGLARQELLQGAFRALDHERCAYFYQTYPGAAPVAAAPAPAPARPSLEARISPGPAAGPSAPRTAQKPIFKESEAKAFYKAVALGKTGMTQEQIATRQRELYDAAQDGRLIAG